MKKGDIVTIYEDPITEKKPEGRARIICKFISDLGEVEGFTLARYEVEFLNEPGRTFERTIKEASNEAKNK